MKKEVISWKSREMHSPVMYGLVAPCLASDYKEANIVCFEIEDCAVATGDSAPGISRGDNVMGTITTKAGQGYIAMKTRVIEREDVQVYSAILAHKAHGDTALQDLKGGAKCLIIEEVLDEEKEEISCHCPTGHGN